MRGTRPYLANTNEIGQYANKMRGRRAVGNVLNCIGCPVSRVQTNKPTCTCSLRIDRPCGLVQMTAIAHKTHSFIVTATAHPADPQQQFAMSQVFNQQSKLRAPVCATCAGRMLCIQRCIEPVDDGLLLCRNVFRRRQVFPVMSGDQPEVQVRKLTTMTSRAAFAQKK